MDIRRSRPSCSLIKKSKSILNRHKSTPLLENLERNENYFCRVDCTIDIRTRFSWTFNFNIFFAILQSLVRVIFSLIHFLPELLTLFSRFNGTSTKEPTDSSCSTECLPSFGSEIVRGGKRENAHFYWVKL